ncbi:unnamed protein product [Ceratitis capitata]|uniref:(Mediterranean fruit fly) hypothetical protein n=1 Tax=Ceratitis capitata TaxID=7213 RepID=A0A811UH13_CERCA|nr:unnamed protein product [Ceratitis capitata]
MFPVILLITRRIPMNSLGEFKFCSSIIDDLIFNRNTNSPRKHHPDIVINCTAGLLFVKFHISNTLKM